MLCLIHWAEHDGGKTLGDEEIMEVIKHSRKQGWCGKDCYVFNPPAVYNYVRGFEAFKYALVEKSEKVIAALSQYIICNYKKTENAEYRHFTAMVGGSLFDPLPPGRPAAAGYTVESYRILV